jgi:hypothetical protein
LAKILIARYGVGVVLLMRCFTASGEATSDLNGVFHRESHVLDMFPSLEKAPDKRQEGVFIA